MSTQAKKDLEPIRGWMRTHFDCENCPNSWDVEGDATGDEVECEDCGAKYVCSNV